MSPVLVALGIVAIVAVIFIVQNSERANVDFLFLDVSSRVWVALLVAIGFGIVLDRLLMYWWNRRRRSATELTLSDAPRPSSDGVAVAVHELAGRTARPPTSVLIAHATGFHGHAYLPVAAASPAFHTVAFDFRGHGDTPLAPGLGGRVGRVRRRRLAAAGLRSRPCRRAAADRLRALDGRNRAAARRPPPPRHVRVLVLFEPIVPDRSHRADADSHPVTPLVTATRRRRTLFPSIEAALANYASKPPLSAFDPRRPRRLRAPRLPPGRRRRGIRLKCDPELEARTFEAGRPAHVGAARRHHRAGGGRSGRVEDDQPSRFAADGRRRAAPRPLRRTARPRPLRADDHPGRSPSSSPRAQELDPSGTTP